MVWGLEFLRREGAASCELDFAPLLPRLLEANRKEFAELAPGAKIELRRPSYLFGDPPILLMLMHADASAADELYAHIGDNLDLPILELMWGFAGTMLACISASEITGDGRWRDLFQAQARRLLSELEDTEFGPLWTQVLYGRTHKMLGPVHGYAGNMQALLRGWDWLVDVEQERVKSAILATLEANAWRSELGANWQPVAGRETTPLAQYCHGAPGMITALADPRVATPELVSILEDGARLVWGAGALTKGSNLCHGTGGNGFAFLKLHVLTGDAVWLDRAKAFAMTGIDQYRTAKAQYGRGRFSLWTGDIGLAVYLHECLAGSARFPTIDVF